MGDCRLTPQSFGKQKESRAEGGGGLSGGSALATGQALSSRERRPCSRAPAEDSGSTTPTLQVRRLRDREVS